MIIKDYEVVKKLGEGGMAEVYLGRHVRLKHKYVAIKKLFPWLVKDGYISEKFHQEADIQSALGDHKNIVKVENFFEENGEYYIVMEFIGLEKEDNDGYPMPADTLGKYVIKGKGMPMAQALRWFNDICGAVSYAHSRGVIHRDLKPSNILIDKFGEIKVSDFGIAKMIGDEKGKTRSGTRVGTLPYMAPEQIRGKEIGSYTDIYALGIILYKMLTGDYPYDIDTNSSDYDIQKAHVEEEPDLSRIGDVHLREIIAKCLEKEPKNRYQKIEDLLKDLENTSGIQPKLDLGSETKDISSNIKSVWVIVPSCIGIKKEDAINLLTKIGLRPVITYTKGKTNQILGQNLREGTAVKRGTLIVLNCGSGDYI